MYIISQTEGFLKDDDRLPEKFYQQEIKTGRLIGSVIDKEKFKQAIETYYEMMGWDRQGIPFDGTLYDYDLDWTISIIEEFRN